MEWLYAVKFVYLVIIFWVFIENTNILYFVLNFNKKIILVSLLTTFEVSSIFGPSMSLAKFFEPNIKPK